MGDALGPRVDPKVLEAARAQLIGGREALEGGDAALSDWEGCEPASGRHPGSGRAFGALGGIARAERTTSIMDSVLTRLAEAAAALKPDGAQVALVALGGYGRRELGLRSDVDVLFLIDADRPANTTYIEAFLYALWDLGLEVGHSVRTPAATLSWAAEEQSVLSSLLDARLLPAGAGAAVRRQAAFLEVERGIDGLLSRPEVARGLFEAKIEEGRRRRERYGETVYLLEPNIKESAGGLRDLHVALWVSRARFKTHGLHELLRLGVLSPQEHKTLCRAYDFLLRVRFELHRISRRRQDHLRFEHQERIAEILGYTEVGERDHDRRKHGVERFMRAYYFHARNTRIVSGALLERATRVRASRDRNGRNAPGGFRVWSGMLTVAGVTHFVRDPSAMVRIFEVAQDEGLEVHPHAKHLLFEQRGLIDKKWRRDRRVIDPFISILEDPKHDGASLEQMHDVGLLRQLIPEMGRVTARWQHSLYHVYTVDAHVIEVLRIAKRLFRGDMREAQPKLTRLFEAVPRPGVIYMACLLHDIGKGWPREDHSVRGAKVARAVGERFEAACSSAWGREDTRDLEWLVKAHLLMSDISQRRDLSDPQLVLQFAQAVENEERLNMLYLLTVADMMGTSPKVWTSWKAALLNELYTNTRAALRSEDGEGARRHLDARRARVQEVVMAQLEGRTHAGMEARAFLAAVPDRYLLAVSGPRIARHVRMWSRVRRHGGLATHVSHLRRDGVSEFTVVCPDRPGLLACVAGVLAANDLSILSASLFSMEKSGLGDVAPPGDGASSATQGDFDHVPATPREERVALDMLHVTDAQGSICDSGERWNRVRRDLESILVEGRDSYAVVGPRVWRPYGLRPHRPAVKTEVKIVNGVGDDVVLDVFCEDHIGVLWVIARTLAERGLTIALAKISTQGHRVADGFYLRDAETGERVTDHERLHAAARSLRVELSDVLKDRRETVSNRVAAQSG